ncbi:MAG: hypothetical protein ROR55_28740 [Devosia sp.]
MSRPTHIPVEIDENGKKIYRLDLYRASLTPEQRAADDALEEAMIMDSALKVPAAFDPGTGKPSTSKMPKV